MNLVPRLPQTFNRRFALGALVLVPIAAVAVLRRSAGAAEPAVSIPPPAADLPAGEGLQTAVLAGGCFWGVQAVYQHTTGVTRAVSGYAGGSQANARYELVGSGTTGHAEAVEVTFDPKKVSFGKILQIFFSVAHDPTQLDRQGPDYGPQYRSAIFYRDAGQKRVAEAYVAQLNAAGVYRQPIVTRLEQLPAFYPAEDYHQDYATVHPNHPYIVYNDRPKVENLQGMFPDQFRVQPVLVRATKAPTN